MDKRDNYRYDLDDVENELRELRREQEEEVGRLYNAGRNGDAERLAQRYGNRMNKLEKKRETLRKRISNSTSRIQDLTLRIARNRNKIK